MKGVGKRRAPLLDDLKNRRRYWEVKLDAEDRENCKRKFITQNEEEVQVIFHKIRNLLTGSVLNNNSIKLNLWFTAPERAIPVN